MILASGVILVVASTFEWLGARITTIEIGRTVQRLGPSPYSFAHNAWGYTVTLIAVLLGIAMLGFTTLKLLGLAVPDRFGPVSAGQVMLGLGTVSLALVLMKIAVGPRVELASFGLPNLPTGIGTAVRISTQTTRGFGSLAGAVATAGLFIGGLLKFREEHAAPTGRGY